MRHRPYCAAAALGLLVAALSVGPLFQGPGLVQGHPGEADHAFDPSHPRAGRPVEAAAPRPVQSVGFTANVSSFGALAAPPSLGGEPADPDGVGPCPHADLPAVVRRGIDTDGQDTWWHVDGSITKRGPRTVPGGVVPCVTRMQAPTERVAHDAAGHVIDDHDSVVVK